MNCIDLMSKLSKMLRYVAKHSKQRKTTKEIKLQWISSIWHQNDLKCWVTSQNYKCDHITMNLHRFDVKTITTQNYESDQIIMNCIDLTSKRSKMLRYVAKHSKQRKTTKLIKLQWIASIWCQNNQKTQTMNCIDLMSKQSKMLRLRRKTFKTTQNYEKKSNYNEFHRFDVKTITTTQNYESDQIIMHCINLTSKRSKKLSYVPKLQKWSHYNELHRFDVKTIKNVEVRRKTFKTTQNYKRNQITMNFIDLTSKRSQQRKTTKVIKL